MKKNNLIVCVCYIIWGIVNLLAALFTDTKLDGIFFGMAGAGIVIIAQTVIPQLTTLFS